MASVASAPESPAVQTMLRMPNIRLMSFARAEALTRIFPNLVRLVLPQGVFDIAENIPPNDVAAFVTWAQEKGYPFELREIALAHGVGDATAQAYNRGDQKHLRLELMQAWSNYVTGTTAA